jgi:glutamate N-acetyltransferase/amino-acid N-acetyltransferase
VAGKAGCSIEEVLPFSTGVIGQRLPTNKLIDVLPGGLKILAPDAWPQAAAAIMTTDTIAKGVSRTVFIDDTATSITGIAKGAGMIRPDMATMLAFIATDAGLTQVVLQDMLNKAVDASFNHITVDGDTSPNDACVLIATGKSSAQVYSSSAKAREQFQSSLLQVMTYLAQAVVRDGEGATKYITVDVHGAANVEEARRTAFTIAHSPLVKTAFFASDPNWGRILSAVGRAGIERLDINRVVIFLNELCVVRQGGPSADYTEAIGRRIMAGPEVTIKVDLHRDQYSFRLWTSDLSYDYVRINAEYRS